MAYIRQEGTWYLAYDASVSEVSQESMGRLFKDWASASESPNVT